MRNRLILSHTLPLLIIFPLLGIGLINLLETRIYLPAIANEMESDARFMGQLTKSNEEIWHRSDMAQQIVQLYGSTGDASMMLLDSSGALLSSSNPLYPERSGQILDGVDFSAIRQSPNGATQQIHYNPGQGDDVIDIFVPVNTDDGRNLGFVCISYPFASMIDEIYQLRFLIIFLLGSGLLIGSVAGYILAISVSNPVREVTHTIRNLPPQIAVPGLMRTLPGWLKFWGTSPAMRSNLLRPVAPS